MVIIKPKREHRPSPHTLTFSVDYSFTTPHTTGLKLVPRPGNIPLEVRDDRILAHLHMVLPIATAIRRTLPPCFDIDDLISVGSIGLIHAAESYQPRRKVPFHAWAILKIRGAILDWVGGSYETKSGMLPRRNWRDAVHGPLTPAMAARIGAEDTAGDKAVERSQITRDLKAAGAQLTPKARHLILLHYGQESTMRQTAEGLGLGLTLTHQLHRHSLRVLRRQLEMRGRKAA